MVVTVRSPDVKVFSLRLERNKSYVFDGEKEIPLLEKPLGNDIYLLINEEWGFMIEIK